MIEERWRRLEAIFHRAVDLEVEARARYLEEACDGDGELRAEVESLIAAERGEDRIAKAVGEAAAGAAFAEESLDLVGEPVGPYLVVKKLGEGGMGAVFLAERSDDQYRSRVAVKLVRGLAGIDALYRFRRERQILADLAHPGIARLLDGGTTSGGLPYVIMEYVEGEPIHEYCDRRRLALRDRVALLREVAKAVQFAHSRLVVHRDIKPANILVTSEGIPKLLDFGIAKSLAGETAGAAVGRETQSMVRLFTPSYASPEQVKGEPVTVASDVYGLGAVLYELLAGRSPHQLRGTSPAELERVICEEPHRPLPQAVDPGGTPDAQDRAERRGFRSPRELAAALDSDLDNIVAMALRKEPERRYPSVERFSDDLGRYLEGRPVTARADDWTYRARKFVSRHRLAVGASAFFVLSLLGFALAISLQAGRLAEQRDLAERKRLEAEQVSDFLIETFRVSDPNENPGDTVTARELLDRAAERIEALADQPAMRASLEDTMGVIYMYLGLYEQAAPLLESALELRRNLNQADDPDVAWSLGSLGSLRSEIGDYEAAIGLLQQSVDMYRRLNLEETEAAVESLTDLAVALERYGSYDEAEAGYRAALAIHRRQQGEETTAVADDLQNLSGILRTLGEYEEAERLNRESLALRRRLLGNDHLDVAHSLNQLARLLSLKGDAEAALPVALEGLQIRRKAHKGAHVEVAASLGNVAGILGSLGRHDESLAYRLESLEVVEEIVGRDHPYFAATLSSLGEAHLRLRHFDEAETVLRESVAAHRRLYPEGNVQTAHPLTALGETLLAIGRPGEAEEALEEALRLRLADLPPEHWFIAKTRSLLGEALVRQGRIEEGKPHLVAGHERLEAEFGSDDERTVEARERLRWLSDAPVAERR
jgi:serine/threonine-protein kinase